jgi:hypothetical protein
MPPEFTNTGDEWEPADGTEELYSGCFVMVPEYSSSIEAAWTIVEKLREKYTVSIEIDSLICCCEIWSDAKRGSYYDKIADTGGETMPLAICRAALIAITTAPTKSSPSPLRA